MSIERKYRQRIYEKYSSEFQGSDDIFRRDLGERFLPTFDHYFRGWLPKHENADIADLACGSGIFLYYLKKCGYQNITGVDICPEQVAICRQITPRIEHGCVFEFLRRHPDRFELLTALNMIEHLSKDESTDFLKACWSALKPGGRLILMTPNADALFSATMRYGDFTHETIYNFHSLSHLLRLHRFVEIQARETGPVPRGYSSLSSIRYLVWQLVRRGIECYHYIETGGPGSGIFTRVFTISATKNSNDEILSSGEK